MTLIEAEGGEARDGVVSRVAASRSVTIRVARWPADDADGEADPRGTVVVCTGRSEFIEKYYEVVRDLRARGFAVVVFDWRGQGLSDRLLSDRRKGHVWSFVEFEQDLEAVRAHVLEPFCPRPWFGLGHSMGGPILLNYAARRPDVFQRIVLSAPMFELARVPSPALSRVVARWLCRLGMGGRLVPIGPNRALFLNTFTGNVLTSDQRRFNRGAALLRAEPRLGLGPPTFGWLNAAFDCIAALDTDRFGKDFMTPTLIVMPGADVVVNSRAAERLAARLRTGTFVPVVGALHEVMMEREDLRQQFWAAFDAFIPGSGLGPPRPAPEPASRGMTAALPVP